MDFQQTLRYLFSLNSRGIKLGLDRVHAFLGELGQPQTHFKSIHIAGTNGKGTVSQLIYSVLRAAGRSTGIYTSPHLLRFNERIIVNNHVITDEAVCAFVEQYRALFDQYELTFFEITTALAFHHFKLSGVEWAVLETGMGGRLDATNVVAPAVSVITDISLDHEQYLGKTIREIAHEKAGIIKAGVPVVFGVTDAEARQVIEETAVKLTDYRDVLEAFESQILEETAQDTSFSVKMERWNLENLYLPLSGRHQVQNALVALAALERVCPDLTEDHIREGFKTVRLRGRLEFIKGAPDLLLDVAHNPKKISGLNEYLIRFFPRRKVVIVFGVMADKNYEQMVQVLEREKREFVFVRPQTERALEVEKLMALRPGGKTAESTAEAVKVARDLAGKRGLVVVTGSFFTVSEAMNALSL